LAGALGVCLSGGGSSILALTPAGLAAAEVAGALASAAARLGVKGRLEIADIDQHGAHVSLSAASSVVTGHQALEPALICPTCGSRFPLERPNYRCRCGEPLDVRLPEPNKAISGAEWRQRFDARLGSVEEKLDTSGVWRFRELLLPVTGVVPVSRPEGQTNLYPVGRDQEAASNGFRRIGEFVGLDRLWLKHEGENPTGSFKDRGMTVAVSIARWLGASAVACASTGNTAASMAAYAAQAGLPAIVLLPEGKVASGKLGQALAYGAQIQQVAGDFDVAMSRVEEMCLAEGIYLLNSLNPFRLVG
jgi:threonine synthase